MLSRGPFAHVRRAPLLLHMREHRQRFVSSLRDRLIRLENAANERPKDAFAQAALLRELTRAGMPELAVARQVSNRFANTGAARTAYYEALRAAESPSAAYAEPTVAAATGAGGGARLSAYERMAPRDYFSQPSATSGTSATYAAEEASSAQQAQPVLVKIVKDEWTTGTAMRKALENVVFWVASLGLFYYLFRETSNQGAAGGPAAMIFGAKNHEILGPDMDKKTFEDVRGVDEAKADLQDIVQFLRRPTHYTRLGGKLPKGVLLTGPPGTGKTLLAKAVAGEAGVPFFYVSGSEFEEMFVGLGAKRIRDLFAAAKKKAPCIVFIDEIDAIGGKRVASEVNQHAKMSLNQLLVELDGFKASEGVIVLAATNFPEMLDGALVRPGRFDRTVAVPLPDIQGRREIMSLYLKTVPTGADVNVDALARATSGLSGADLANVINTAALEAAKSDSSSVAQKHLNQALERVLMGAERLSAVIPEAIKRSTAYHEGGHALVAMLTKGSLPLHKATIVPRGHALGMVVQLPEEKDMLAQTKMEILAQIDICLGGRIAEEIVLGADNITSGAGSDLIKATSLARNMIASYGMNPTGSVGLQVVDPRSSSPETLRLVDEEVKAILDASATRVRELIKAHRKDLELIAMELVKKETLSQAELKQLLKL